MELSFSNRSSGVQFSGTAGSITLTPEQAIAAHRMLVRGCAIDEVAAYFEEGGLSKKRALAQARSLDERHRNEQRALREAIIEDARLAPQRQGSARIIWGVLFVLGGASGAFVLEGTKSGFALAAVGCAYIFFGILQRMRGQQDANADDDPYRRDLDGEDSNGDDLEEEEGDDEGAELEDTRPDATERCAPRLVCPDCGAKNDADALFCTKCAARLHEAEAPEEDVLAPEKPPRYVE